MTKNPTKKLMYIVIAGFVVLAAIMLFKKDKIQLEGENGETYTGASGKFLKTDAADEDKAA